jgi:hypothetical protein
LDAVVADSGSTGHDPWAAAREARAEHYFEHDLAGQRGWYGERAARFKTRAQLLGVAVIAAGAGTTFLQVFGGAPWVAVATALLGVLVALAEGWRQIARYDEAWTAYRQASEQMKRERRLYVNGAGEYRGVADEEEAFLRFVEAVEAIVAEEQRLYWKNRGEGTGGRATAASGTGAGDRSGAGLIAVGEQGRGRP